jgi:hypothetical protein
MKNDRDEAVDNAKKENLFSSFLFQKERTHTHSQRERWPKRKYHQMPKPCLYIITPNAFIHAYLYKPNNQHPPRFSTTDTFQRPATHACQLHTYLGIGDKKLQDLASTGFPHVLFHPYHAPQRRASCRPGNPTTIHTMASGPDKRHPEQTRNIPLLGNRHSLRRRYSPDV